MLEKIGKNLMQLGSLFFGFVLVTGTVLFLRNQQNEKDLAQAAIDAAVIKKQATDLQKVLNDNLALKKDAMAQNSGKITVQQPKTVTQVIPGGTQVVKVAAPAKTSKKS